MATACYVPHGPFSGCVAQCADSARAECAAEEPAGGSFCCWKHAEIDPLCRYTPQATAYVIAVRDPYSWLASLHRNPYEYLGPRKLPFAAFLRRQKVPVVLAVVPSVDEHIPRWHLYGIVAAMSVRDADTASGTKTGPIGGNNLGDFGVFPCFFNVLIGFMGF